MVSDRSVRRRTALAVILAIECFVATLLGAGLVLVAAVGGDLFEAFSDDGDGQTAGMFVALGLVALACAVAAFAIGAQPGDGRGGVTRWRGAIALGAALQVGWIAFAILGEIDLIARAVTLVLAVVTLPLAWTEYRTRAGVSGEAV